jgi:hypothetical protein
MSQKSSQQTPGEQPNPNSHESSTPALVETVTLWPSEPLEDVTRDATFIEKRRGDHAWTILKETAIERPTAISILTEVGPMFCLGHASPELIKDKTKGVGMKTAKEVPDATEFNFFTPDNWDLLVTYPPNPLAIYSHSDSRTSVIVAKQSPADYNTYLFSLNAPSAHALQLTPIEQTSGKAAFQFSDVAMQFATDHGGYDHSAHADEFAQHLPFKKATPDLDEANNASIPPTTDTPQDS